MTPRLPATAISSKNGSSASIDRMKQEKFITDEEYKSARKEQITFQKPENSILAPHFVFYVKEMLEREYGTRKVQDGGLRVYTTLDYSLQQKAQKILQDELASLSGYNVNNGAILITRPSTGEILAMVGSRDFFGKDGAFNVTTAQRQPGSSIKPFTYLLALKNGMSPTSLISDSPVKFDGYAPVNYDGKFHGLVPMRYALANSYNIPAVQLLRQVGVDNFVRFGALLGLSGWEGQENRFGLSLTLGGGEVSMIDFATAYGVLRNLGDKTPTHPIARIENSIGEVIFQQENNPTTVTRPEETFIVSDMLADNVARTPAFGPNSALNFGDTMKDRATSIVLDNEGNILVSGTFQGTIDLDPGIAEEKLSATGVEDAFVLKLSSEGKFISSIHLGGPGSVVCKSLCIDELGNGLLTGYFTESGFTVNASNTAIVVANQTGSFIRSTFICKITNINVVEWIKQIKRSEGNCIKSDTNGNVYIGGSFLGEVDFDPGEADSILYGHSNESAFVLKLNSSGEFVWANQLTTNQLSYCSALEVNKNGQVFAAGTVNLPELVGQNYQGFRECFVISLSSEGQIVWEKEIGGKRHDFGYGLALNSRGEIFVTGCFQDTVDFDPGEGIDLTNSKSSADMFVIKLDSLGMYIWKGILSGIRFTASPAIQNYSAGIRVNIDKNDNVYLSGSFYQYCEFITGQNHFDFSPAGLVDMYLIKLGIIPNEVMVEEIDFGLYPNPCYNNVFIQSAQIGSTLEVFDATGKLVISTQLLETNNEVRLDSLSDGLYFFKTFNKDHQIIIKKVLKL